MSKKNFDSKLKYSKNLIEDVLSKHKKPVVACSFGKHSMIVLHLVQKFRPDTPVLFNDTLMEYPDTYEFKEKITKEWNLNIIETKPKRTFWWVVENYGFPLFSRKGHRSASKNCCRNLKEYPVKKVLNKYHFDLYFTGLSRHESRLREFSAKKYGDYFYSKTFKHWKCHPIQNWTEKDVWEYHKRYNILHNGIYNKKPPNGFEIRTACWCCTIPIKYGKLEFLRNYYPFLWKILLKKGLGKLILEKKLDIDISQEKVEHFIEKRPCLFDKF